MDLLYGEDKTFFLNTEKGYCNMIKSIKAPVKIRDDELVTYTQIGKQAKITYVKHRNTLASIRRVDKDHYIIIGDESGVVHEFKHTENRRQSIKSVRKSLNELCDIINANVSDIERCKWVTLTYVGNMTDLKKLTQDWENFRKKVRRKWGNFEYIKVQEPQGRGSWHLHVLMIFKDKAPYMDNEVLYKIWGKGFVSVKNMTQGVDSGLYFTTSLSDMTVSEAEKEGFIIDPQKLSKDKKYVKGARLSLYPKGVRIFNCSKGITRPKKETMTKAQADLLVRDKRQVTQYSKILTNDEGLFINEISVTKYIDK